MTNSPEEIQDYIESLGVDTQRIKDQLVDIMFFMKGAVDMSTAYGMSYQDRERCIKRVNKWNKLQSGDDTEYM